MIHSTTFTPNHRTAHRHHHQFSSLHRKPAPQHPAPERPANGVRSATLNRLDLLRRRRERDQTEPKTRALEPNEIYAPASIACADELHLRRPPQVPTILINGRQQQHHEQHYAATSYRGSESGRESALANLFERFGTLTRRAKSRLSATSRKLTNGETKPPNPIYANGSILNGYHSRLRHSSATPTTSSGSGRTSRSQQLSSSSGAGATASGQRHSAADEIYSEGLEAIDGNALPRPVEHEIDVELMSEGETRTLVSAESLGQPKVQQLQLSLVNWINDELADQRIIVKDLADDLHDGQVLCRLVERLQRLKLDIVEVTQNERTQKIKLRRVLDTVNRTLSLQARWARIRWSVDGIHGKNLAEIIQLLVALSVYYRAPIKIEPNIFVDVVTYQKYQSRLVCRSNRVQLTGELPNVYLKSAGQRQQQRDVFDNLLDFAPDKLETVRQTLAKFCNRHLKHLKSPLKHYLEPDEFSDGTTFVFLIAALEGYFVPLGNLYFHPNTSIDANNNDLPHAPTCLQPTNYINTQSIEKLHNVNVALQLMQDAGLKDLKDRVRAEDIVNGDLKSILRVLFTLFGNYKHL